jgi:hypothetical protein
MEDKAIDLDQADEKILACTVSDEALEAVAGTERGMRAASWGAESTISPYCFGCWRA